MLVFVFTFIVFPGAFFDSHLRFMDSMKDEFTWYSQISITLFNILDTIGRNLGGKVRVSPKCTYFLSISRGLTVVFAIWIVILGDDSSIFITQDWFKVLNIALFSISNGFVSTLLAIQAP